MLSRRLVYISRIHFQGPGWIIFTFLAHYLAIHLLLVIGQTGHARVGLQTASLPLITEWLLMMVQVK